MVAYSFQRQFIDPITIGLQPGPPRPKAKRHTIRANGKRRHARPGERLQLYRGLRTRSCFKIGDAVCTDAQPIEIHFRLDPTRDWMVVGDKKIGPYQLEEFAEHDGFESWMDLREFWREHHPGVRDFTGTIIYWEPLP